MVKFPEHELDLINDSETIKHSVEMIKKETVHDEIHKGRQW
jgi:hypothetical protein